MSAYWHQFAIARITRHTHAGKRTMSAVPNLITRQSGLEFWMGRVLQECDQVAVAFAPDPVHDLRVALRRCRSLADGMMKIDAHPAWKRMKKSGKRLFSCLGELRDSQVMADWIRELDLAEDLTGQELLALASTAEVNARRKVLEELNLLDRERWDAWRGLLTARASKVPLDSVVFKHLALERWAEGYELHKRALRNRTQAAYHQLRIGIKRFRYTVENFLPKLHASWENDLKQLQDALGEVHDLDILLAAASRTHSFSGDQERTEWREHVQLERGRRLEKYRQKMVGRDSLWQQWRESFPQGEEIEQVARERLDLWASFLDPDPEKTNSSARLTMQLYDGLSSLAKHIPSSARRTLELAATLRNVGRGKRLTRYHKVSARMIRRLDLPLGLQRDEVEMAALVVRYHRGGLPRPEKRRVASLSKRKKFLFIFLTGVLRFSTCVDRLSSGPIRRLTVSDGGGFLAVQVHGRLQRERSWERLAAARFLLEAACRKPIQLLPAQVQWIADAGATAR